MSKVVVAGGGAAGMMAAIFLARNGHEVVIVEKNEKLGKKLFITGKGRCNVTNASDIDVVLNSIQRNKKFMYSALYSFTNDMTMEFFEEIGVKLKVERGNRVFPVSDHSSDIINSLIRELKKLKVEILLNTAVKELIVKEDKVTGVLLEDNRQMPAKAVVVATGGISYETTGSTGDGYKFANKLGIKVEKTNPSLVPMEIDEEYVKELQGLSLKNVSVTIKDGNKRIYEDFGEMLFTHYGISGPMILSASSVINSKISEKKLSLSIDLKPALSVEQLDKRLLREFEENKNKQFKNALNKLFPAKLIPVMISLSQIPEDKPVNEISKSERNHLGFVIKNMQMTITGLRGYNEAIITRGGISVKELDPSTMESKKIKDLYFIGEVLDVDALTGGFNLQIAWSTAYLAGINVL